MVSRSVIHAALGLAFDSGNIATGQRPCTAATEVGESVIVKRLDIAVAGCGTAGLAAALLLARDGHRVVLFEQFDAPCPVGSGLMLQPTGLAVLGELGLMEAVYKRGSRISTIHGRAANRVVLDVRYSALKSASGGAVGVHRAALFDVLHDAVKAAGIPIQSGRRVQAARSRRESAFLSFTDGPEEGPFDLIVDALGSRTPLAPKVGRDLRYAALWTNVDWIDGISSRDALTQRYRNASVMAGILPIGTSQGRAQAAFFWSLRADRFAHWRDRGLDAWKADVRALWPDTSPLLDQIKGADDLTFARYCHRTLSAAVGPRIIHIGDAWHSASPQLGQGANMALLDAFALALGLRAASEPQEGLDRAARLRRHHVRLYQVLTAILTPVHQSDSRSIAIVRDRLMGPLSKLWPITALQTALVSGLIGSPLKSLGIAFAPEGGRR